MTNPPFLKMKLLNGETGIPQRREGGKDAAPSQFQEANQSKYEGSPPGLPPNQS